ncbi:MAG: hypothetical protein ACLRMZ_12035 [Blautia marasmi]
MSITHTVVTGAGAVIRSIIARTMAASTPFRQMVRPTLSAAVGRRSRAAALQTDPAITDVTATDDAIPLSICTVWDRGTGSDRESAQTA